MNDLVEQIMKLSAEVERLRGVLREIDELCPPGTRFNLSGEIAREALRTPSLNEASEGLAKEE